MCDKLCSESCFQRDVILDRVNHLISPDIGRTFLCVSNPKTTDITEFAELVSRLKRSLADISFVLERYGYKARPRQTLPYEYPSSIVWACKTAATVCQTYLSPGAVLLTSGLSGFDKAILMRGLDMLTNGIGVLVAVQDAMRDSGNSLPGNSKKALDDFWKSEKHALSEWMKAIVARQTSANLRSKSVAD